MTVGMEIEFDTAKDEANKAKHGVSLELGAVVIANAVGDVADNRWTHEQRRKAFGPIAGRLFVCVYTMRGEIYRIISVRRANRRERRKWQS
jgi:uncharacterized DUF497 family protein